jgi:ABC-type glycerol-3-phosphate transport system substrate-binding protein
MKPIFRTTTLLIAASLMLGACAFLSPEQTAIPISATETALPEITPTVSSTTQTETVLLWVAPAFDPETQAGQLLSGRLAAFESQQANVRISVRVKPVGGSAGLLNTLAAASVAAPAAVPDLLTLPPDDLQLAAASALIIPLPESLVQSEDPAWYDYALPPSRHEGLTYGFPFASEVEILGYRIALYPEPPRSWETLLAEPRTLLFPAADPRARFILAMYKGAGGNLTDENSQPWLDVNILEQVLNILSSARSSSVLPLAVRQYSSPLETWTELKANRSASAMAPMADFLREGDPESMAAVALPTEESQGIALALTWSWAMTPGDPSREELMLELVAWLSDPAFAGSLTHALGYLPTSQEALAAWPDDVNAALASSLVTITQPEPEKSLRDAITPALLAAIEAVLGAGEDAALAAQEATNLVNSP